MVDKSLDNVISLDRFLNRGCVQNLVFVPILKLFWSRFLMQQAYILFYKEHLYRLFKNSNQESHLKYLAMWI
jgi:hypothetical protein